MKKVWAVLLSMLLLLPLCPLPPAAAEAAGWKATAPGDTLTLDFGEEKRINRISLNEVTDGAVEAFHIEVLDGDEWKQVYDNDYILAGRTCILPEDVTTAGVRLVIDRLAGEAEIDSFAADYQENSRDTAFMNVGHITNLWYDSLLTGNFDITKEQLHSMTDWILQGSCNFDQEGGFCVLQMQDDQRILLEPQEALAATALWKKRLKGGSGDPVGEPARFWFALTPFDETISPMLFLDETVRDRLAGEVARFAAETGMTGVELDWDLSGDPQGWRLLTAALAKRLHETGCKLAVSCTPKDADKLTAEEFAVIDYLDCKAYGLSQIGETGVANAAYWQATDLTERLIAVGCAPEKLWLGLPDHVFVYSTEDTEPSVEFGNGRQWAYWNFLTYLCREEPERENRAGCNRFAVSDTEQYLGNGVSLIRDKTAYAAAKGLGGVCSSSPCYDLDMFWDEDTQEWYDVLLSGKDSLTRTVYDTVARFTGADPLEGSPTGDLTCFDGTAWTADAPGDMLQLDLEGERRINRIRLMEETYGAVQAFHIDVEQNGVWRTVYDNDYILSDRTCILPEDVTASAVRLVVDELYEAAVLTGFSADLQETRTNSSFMNVGYISHQRYEMDNGVFSVTTAQLESLTDLILIGNFGFDQSGLFSVFAHEKQGINILDKDDPYADFLMNQWIQKVKTESNDLNGGQTRLWCSLTALDRNAANSTAFLDEGTRRRFAEDAVAFAKKYGFYGIDVDWEYPDESEEALLAYRLMLATLSQAAHEAGLRLSATLCPNYKDFLGREEFAVLDYVSFMTYTNLETGGNVRAQVTYLKMKTLVEDAVARGCKAAQIWVGLPFFGRSETTTLGYGNIAWNLSDGRSAAKGKNQEEKMCFNGAYLIQDKVSYAVDFGCAGVMSWWPGQDIKAFYDDEIDPQTGLSGADSLTRAVYEAVKRFTGVDPLAERKPGDLDRDGSVTVTDALYALRIAVGLEQPTAIVIGAGDIDRDGTITVADALKILRMAVGLQ